MISAPAFSIEEFRALVEPSLMGLVVYDAKSAKLIDANPRMAEISGRTVEELIGITLGSFVHPDDRDTRGKCSPATRRLAAP